MTTRNVLFGGGFDSTWHVIALTKLGIYDEIKCIYMKNIDYRKSTKRELETLDKLVTKYSEVTKTVVNVPPKETIITEDYVKKGLELGFLVERTPEYIRKNENYYKNERKILKYQIKEYLGYKWAHKIYNLQTNIFMEYINAPENKDTVFDMLMIGGLRDSQNNFPMYEYLDNHKKTEPVILDLGTLDCRVNVDAYPELYIMKNIRLPMFHISKNDAAEEAIANEMFDDEEVNILTSSVSCHMHMSHRHMRNDPCGKCYLCEFRSDANENIHKQRRKIRKRLLV